LVLHHAVTDGWSAGVILRELAVLYEAFLEGRESPLSELPVQYADWAAWQRRWLEGGELERQLTWWARELADLRPLELPTDRPRGSHRGVHAARAGFTLPDEDSAAIVRFARAEHATLFQVLLACFQALLSRFAEADDVVVGTPMA